MAKAKRAPIPVSEWKWYGYAGHLCVASRCAYHLTTRIGGFLISTVGDFRPNRDDKRETIGAGADSFFETYVFKCGGEDANGDPILDGMEEIDGARYANSIDAERGHYEFCEKYAGRRSGTMIAKAVAKIAEREA